MKNKVAKIALKSAIIFVCSVLALLLLVYVGEKIWFAHFFANSDREMKIPGLSEGYVPQGFDYIDERDAYLACGYMKDGSASRIYMMNEDGRVIYEADMKKADGSDYTGHTGGIAYFGDYLYVSGGNGCDMFLLSDLVDGDGKVTLIGEVKTGNNPAYCKVIGGKLYAGAFYHTKGGYDTPTEHQITTPSGDKNMAILTVFTLDPVTGKAISDTPDVIYSTTAKVQGMNMTETGKILLSTSYGLSTSHLYVHNPDLSTDGEFDFNGTKVPLIYLDSATLEKDVRMPAMAEEIVYDDGEVYVMNESACSKYMFGKLTSGRHVWAYELD